MERSSAKRRSLRLAAAAAVVIVCVIGALAIHGAGGKKVVFTTGLGKDEVFRIGGAVCTVPELKIYLATLQNQYEKVYGAEVWDISFDGVTLEDNIKDTALERLAQTKTMYLLAGEKGLSLDEGEKEQVQAAAAEYTASLSERERELLGADESVVAQLYTEYALADKVYAYIIADVNPEISDDEARTITVQHILLRTYTTDAQGGRIAYSEDRKREIYDRACQIREQAVAEGQDFAELAARYSEDATVTYSFAKGEMEESFETAAFALETGEVSDVIETDAGYHIIRCVSTFDREQTDANKLEIVEQRRREVFGEEYNAFVEKLPRQLNQQLWDSIRLIHDDAVTTSDFFEVFERCFGGS